jgi:GNAT superfamily N-acetyltransferase
VAVMEIRQLFHEQLPDVRILVSVVFMEYEAPDYSEQGIKEFFDTALNNDDFMKNLQIYGAYQNNSLIGIIAMRNEGSHIALFFVDGNYHNQGIGKSLFNIVKEKCKANKITVNSSPYAQDVYHCLGFVDTDTEQIINGIRFIPMIYTK